MATQIYLGMPPANIKKWIEDHFVEPEVDMTKVPLTFTAEEAGAKFSLQSNIGAPTVTLETSTTGEEGSWTPYEVGTEITLANVGDKIMFRNSSNEIQVMGNMDNSNVFNINSGKIAASGNIMFLMDKTGELRDLTGLDCCFYYLFSDCTSLTQAPELPATTLAYDCYDSMFFNCTSLTQAPELPATTLADNCYYNMFWDCSSLIYGPSIIPATFSPGWCCDGMFYDCTSLIKAPELPATTLGPNCYSMMFNRCSSLTQAPELPATTLAADCYKWMFNGCQNIPEPKYNMSHITFDEFVDSIENNYILGYESEGDESYEVKCSDKTIIAKYDWDIGEWILTEK